ncbi:MAG TPA: response regulator [Puia sp.]|nr:response regulator [Puia sp.]
MTNSIVLIADANYEDRQLMKEMICQHNRRIKVNTVSDGRELNDYLSTCKPNRLPSLMILQYELPGADVLQVLERIRFIEAYSRMSKVVWSALASGDIVDRCMRWGAKCCLSKLLRPSAMRQEISGILSAIAA